MAKPKTVVAVPPGKKLIFRKRIVTRTGKVLYPWMYGKKVFVLVVDK